MHDTTDATLSLWARARAMFARAMAALRLRHGLYDGDAAPSFLAELASVTWLSPAFRRELIAWLAPLEHIVRKLLLAEAAALHRAARVQRGPRIEHVPLAGMAQHCRVGTASLQARPAPAVRERCEPDGSRCDLDRSRPETWRAQFSLAIPRDPARVADAHAPRIRALWGEHMPTPEATRTPRVSNEADSPFRLARRFEALRRVLENPRPYAERLVRALARETARRSEVVRAYSFAPCRASGHDPDDPRLTLDAIGHAFEAEQAFDSS